jgi:hypothetical protein
MMYVIHALQHVTFDKAAEQTGVKVDANGKAPKTQFRNHEVVHTWSNVEHSLISQISNRNKRHQFVFVARHSHAAARV